MELTKAQAAAGALGFALIGACTLCTALTIAVQFDRSEEPPTEEPTVVEVTVVVTATPLPTATEEPTPEPATATPFPTLTPRPPPTSRPPTSKPPTAKSFEALVLHIRDVDVWDDAAMTALETELEAHGVDLMTYWGVLADVARQVNVFGIGGDVVSTDTYRLWITRDGNLLNVRVYQ